MPKFKTGDRIKARHGEIGHILMMDHGSYVVKWGDARYDSSYPYDLLDDACSLYERETKVKLSKNNPNVLFRKKHVK